MYNFVVSNISEENVITLYYTPLRTFEQTFWEGPLSFQILEIELQIPDQQGSLKIIDLHRKCKNQKMKKISTWQNRLSKC